MQGKEAGGGAARGLAGRAVCSQFFFLMVFPRKRGRAGAAGGGRSPRVRRRTVVVSPGLGSWPEDVRGKPVLALGVCCAVAGGEESEPDRKNPEMVC